MGKTKRSGTEIVTLKVDKEPVARNPSEKDILWWCLEGIRPHLPFMSADAIKTWCLDAIEFAFPKETLPVKRMKYFFRTVTEKEYLVKKVYSLLLQAEGLAVLPEKTKRGR
ncbi:hypothetical protein DRN58_06650 [Thermococci archaeon]|nr:MAG: hypothetical protein DRN58_06650 [Thermococci archaeon]